jgi:hypothetical protein
MVQVSGVHAKVDGKEVPHIVGLAPTVGTSRPANTSTADQRPEDLSIEFAGELVPMDDGFAAPVASLVSRTASLPPRIEPVVVERQSAKGPAFELNRRSNGVKLSATSDLKHVKRTASAGAPARELSRAVELTREAVYAWVTVFTGPAIVTASQSQRPER